MNFIQDFKVKKNQKIDDEFMLNVKASFYLAYLDQISDKLNLKMEEVEIDDTEGDKKVKTKVIRCSMDMIKPSNKLKINKNSYRTKSQHEEKISINEEDFIKKNENKGEN